MLSAARAIIVHHQNILLMHRHKNGEEYYTLLGGAIESGETAEQAVVRELQEEASITVAKPRLIFIEQATKQFGTQYIFACDYAGGDVSLRADSIEAKLNQQGHDTYKPLWVPVSKISQLPVVSPAVKIALLAGLRDGWPKSPKILSD